jgi:hypothetical protein
MTNRVIENPNNSNDNGFWLEIRNTRNGSKIIDGKHYAAFPKQRQEKMNIVEIFFFMI